MGRTGQGRRLYSGLVEACKATLTSHHPLDMVGQPRSRAGMGPSGGFQSSIGYCLGDRAGAAGLCIRVPLSVREPCPFQALLSRGCSRPQASCPHKGFGCEPLPLGGRHLKGPPHTAQPCPRWPPQAPSSTPNLQTCSPTSWRSYGAGGVLQEQGLQALMRTRLRTRRRALGAARAAGVGGRGSGGRAALEASLLLHRLSQAHPPRGVAALQLLRRTRAGSFRAGVVDWPILAALPGRGEGVQC